MNSLQYMQGDDFPEPCEVEFPIKITEYLHGEKFTEDDRFYELIEEGYDEKFLETNFRCLIYQLKLELELRENGNVYITHVAGQEMNPPIKGT